MHASARRLGLDPQSSGGTRPAPAELERSRHGLEWEALNWCSAAASAALTHWPTQKHRREIIYPLELPRGSEMIEATERRLGQTLDLLRGTGDQLAPVSTIRRVGAGNPWKSRLLAAVANQVCQAIRPAEGLSSFGVTPERLVRPIQALTQRARPAAPLKDPPFSSWPPILSDVYAAALTVLATSTERGRNAGWVPLSDIWRIYEIWLAERTSAILCRLLGQPTLMFDKHRVGMSWQGTNWTLEMRHPCTFSQDPKEMAGSRWCSVSSQLEPDIVLVADGPMGPRLVVLDAKASSDKLSAGYAAQESSKYLWGIRRDGTSIRGATAVVLVSPRGGDEAYCRSAAAQWTIHGHPHAVWQAKPGEIGTEIDSDFFRRLLRHHLGLPV